MTLRFLPEHVPALRASETLARKESEHLRYSRDTLFALPVDLAWVQALGSQPSLAEKVEAFASRFSRLQDQLGDKLLPRFAALVGESPRSFLDTLAFAEKAELLTDADAFIAARRLRNALVHEYMHDPQVFLESLWLAHRTCDLFFDVIDRVGRELARLGVPPA
ncbi:MAG TPA: hypothetical protein PKC60_04735 [Hydrogenophaga sp.]|uniref:hypothetical protein n=1 Tax=Hydrogenophaga sp. TaxID=1904254 RepID=UPI002C4FBAB0|nr:hypothetical protein [Hydrogenophaga sp.]HMN92519.1 hypothetical protein [Hydrogenophaga sp.]HMP10443.1 hypothetical protein [Hydrogenophaga sp.]